MTSADRIERETLISAPVERVWSLVTEPGFWVDEGSLKQVEATAGASLVASHSEHGEFPLQVETVEAPRYISYRWASAFPGDPLRVGNATLVEFTLAPEGDKTRLRVVESGFSSLDTTDERRQKAYDSNVQGWAVEIGKLQQRAEQ